MMEAVRTSETSVDNHFTRQYNPEDSSEHFYVLLHYNAVARKTLSSRNSDRAQLAEQDFSICSEILLTKLLNEKPELRTIITPHFWHVNAETGITMTVLTAGGWLCFPVSIFQPLYKVQLAQEQIYCLLGGITKTTLGLDIDSQVKILTIYWNHIQLKINLILIFVGCLAVI
jgi:hypothetical protein